jgi:outer membrane protein TolC
MELAIRGLVADERQARADIAQATADRTAAADRRALAIGRLVEILGPKKASERFGLTVSALQKPIERAKAIRARTEDQQEQPAPQEVEGPDARWIADNPEETA